jgi:hypothetical protein
MVDQRMTKLQEHFQKASERLDDWSLYMYYCAKLAEANKTIPREINEAEIRSIREEAYEKHEEIVRETEGLTVAQIAHRDFYATFHASHWWPHLQDANDYTSFLYYSLECRCGSLTCKEISTNLPKLSSEKNQEQLLWFIIDTKSTIEDILCACCDRIGSWTGYVAGIEAGVQAEKKKASERGRQSAAVKTQKTLETVQRLGKLVQKEGQTTPEGLQIDKLRWNQLCVSEEVLAMSDPTRRKYRKELENLLGTKIILKK